MPSPMGFGVRHKWSAAMTIKATVAMVTGYYGDIVRGQSGDGVDIQVTSLLSHLLNKHTTTEVTIIVCLNTSPA